MENIISQIMYITEMILAFFRTLNHFIKSGVDGRDRPLPPTLNLQLDNTGK
jgi:hypothetical protein